MSNSARAASGSVSVDPLALQALAGKLTLSAGAIGNHAEEVRANTFGSLQAGRWYSEYGKKIHEGLVRVESWLLQWQEAADALAGAMRQSVVVYEKNDVDAARGVANVDNESRSLEKS